MCTLILCDINVTHSGSDTHDRKLKRCTSVVCDTIQLEITSYAFIPAPELEVHQIHLSLLSIIRIASHTLFCLVSRTLDAFDNYSTYFINEDKDARITCTFIVRSC